MKSLIASTALLLLMGSVSNAAGANQPAPDPSQCQMNGPYNTGCDTSTQPNSGATPGDVSGAGGGGR